MTDQQPKQGDTAANASAQKPATQKKPAQNRAPTQKPAAAGSQVQPNFQMKGTKKLHHHLFASDVVACKKNVSYVPKNPDLQPLEHKHFFHTMDMRGRKLHVSSFSGAHYHDMTWSIDPETGNLIAKSGPPMRMTTNRFEDGTFETVPEQVHWLDKRNKPTFDTHTHEWEYIVTEEFTAQSVEAQRTANRADLEANGVNTTPTVQPIQTAKPLTAEDGVTIREG